MFRLAAGTVVAVISNRRGVGGGMAYTTFASASVGRGSSSMASICELSPRSSGANKLDGFSYCRAHDHGLKGDETIATLPRRPVPGVDTSRRGDSDPSRLVRGVFLVPTSAANYLFSEVGSCVDEEPAGTTRSLSCGSTSFFASISINHTAKSAGYLRLS